MKRKKKISNKEKAEIILAGIKGSSVADICNQYGISQSQYNQWRDQFLSNVDRIFDADKEDARIEELAEENKEYREVIADLNSELKRSERLW